MRKVLSAMLCVVLLAAMTAVSAGAAENISYKWYLSPVVEADDMEVFYNHFGTSNDDTLQFYTVDRMNMRKFVPFEKNGQWGLVDYSGNIALEPQFDHIVFNGGKIIGVNFSSEGLDEKKSKIINDSNGTITVESTLEDVNYYYAFGTIGRCPRPYYWEVNENTLYEQGSGQRVAFISNETRPLIAQRGTKIDLGGQYALKSKDDKIINEDDPDIEYVVDGKVVGDTRYIDGGCFSDGLIALNRSGKWGYLNEKGETVIPFEFDAVSSVVYEINGYETRKIAFEASNGYVALSKNNQFALYNTSGEKVIDFGVFEKILPVYSDGSRDITWVKTNGKWGIIELVESDSDTTTDTTTDTNTDSSSETDSEISTDISSTDSELNTDKDSETDTVGGTDTNNETDTSGNTDTSTETDTSGSTDTSTDTTSNNGGSSSSQGGSSNSISSSVSAVSTGVVTSVSIIILGIISGAAAILLIKRRNG